MIPHWLPLAAVKARSQNRTTEGVVAPSGRPVAGGSLRGRRLALLLALFVATAARAQTNPVVLADDGAWTWYNDPRAIFHNGSLYAGYVRAADGRAALTAYTPWTGALTSLWASTWVQLDDHNNPALLPLEDGRLLALHARHGADNRFHARISASTNPVTAADWSAETAFTNGANVTYQNPYRLAAEPGRIFNFMRCLNFNPTVIYSTNNGASWSGATNLIRAGGGSVRPYVKYASDGTNRIDFLYTDGHPRDVTNSLYHAYYSNGAIRATDGAVLKPWTNLPLLHDSGERGSVVYQYSAAAETNADVHIPTGRAWCWETVLDSNAWPVCVFTVQRDQVMGTNWSDDRIYYYRAWWTPADGWRKRFIAQAGRPLYQAEDDYAGGIALDPARPGTVYLSSNADSPFDVSQTTNVPLRSDGRYRLFRGETTNDGLTFAWTQLSPAGDTNDWLRPYVPRHRGTNDVVVCFRGRYTTYTSYATAVIALFGSPQFVASNPPPATNLVFQGQAVTNWHAGRNTAAPSLDGAATDAPVVGATTSAVNAQVWAYFPPLSLFTGVTVRLQGWIRFDQVPSNGGDQLRFGLFDLNGEAAETAPVFSTIGTTNVDDWRGLYVTVDNAATAGGGALREFIGGTNIFMTGGSRAITRGTYEEANFAALPAGTSVLFRLDVTRTGPTNFDVAGAFDGAAFSFPAIGTSNPLPRFGAFGWLNGNGLGVTSFAFSNVQMGVVGDGPYALWAAQRGQPPGTETADPDGDGHANLGEYATGSDPSVADPAGPLAARSNALYFTRATHATDVTLTLERAADVAGPWSGFATNRDGSWGDATNVTEEGAGAMASVRIDPWPGATNGFLRLRVARP